MFTYTPHGVCSKQILFEIEDNTISSLHFVGGCPGNLEGISRLVQGMNIKDVIAILSGIPCGKKSSSCPDQLCMALEEYLRGEGKNIGRKSRTIDSLVA
ncbi:TIGR03905 family TSCPD domain-containing protein [Halodesulfovibrio aestuarii]|uniref:ribonucleoside-diphosphate reductase n=1 Tax=Halodesulfovibrio aestuarii TaxID=126333 RepID=A0ABV4JWT0_9BACT